VIIVHGTMPLKPASLDEALSLARDMAAATQAEPGCLSYDFYVGVSDPHTLLLFQEWQTMEALMAHFKTEHMELFLRELPRLLSGEIATRRYSVQVLDEESETSTELELELEAGPPVIH
jgi:quinol monooxygenase YgiN